MRTTRLLGGKLLGLGSPPQPVAGRLAFQNILETVRGVPFPVPRAFFSSLPATRVMVTALPPPSPQALALASAAASQDLAGGQVGGQVGGNGADGSGSGSGSLSGVSARKERGKFGGIGYWPTQVEGRHVNGSAGRGGVAIAGLGAGQDPLLARIHGRAHGGDAVEESMKWDTCERAWATIARDLGPGHGVLVAEPGEWLLQGCVWWGGGCRGGLPPIVEVILRVQFLPQHDMTAGPKGSTMHAVAMCDKGASGRSSPIPTSAVIEVSADVFGAAADAPQAICFRKRLEVPASHLLANDINSLVVDVSVRTRKKSGKRGWEGSPTSSQEGGGEGMLGVPFVGVMRLGVDGEVWWIGRTSVPVTRGGS
ncbi:unnamed protein product [Discosporangium mesarthrocarpum]